MIRHYRLEPFVAESAPELVLALGINHGGGRDNGHQAALVVPVVAAIQPVKLLQVEVRHPLPLPHPHAPLGHQCGVAVAREGRGLVVHHAAGFVGQLQRGHLAPEVKLTVLLQSRHT